SRGRNCHFFRTRHKLVLACPWLANCRLEDSVRGQMMNSPLLITSFIDRAGDLFGDVEIVSRRADRSIHRYTYKECRERARRLAMALRGLGLERGDRVATLRRNHYAHVEAYVG